MKADHIFTPEIRSEINTAVKEAEKITSGEIRVFIEDSCKAEALERAGFLFTRLDMHKTKARNGILIYLAVKDHKFAIMGDEGIHHSVHPNFWEEIKQQMQEYFKRDEIPGGILYAVRLTGETLAKFFPLGKDDSNELSDEMNIGESE